MLFSDDVLAIYNTGAFNAIKVCNKKQLIYGCMANKII